MIYTFDNYLDLTDCNLIVISESFVYISSDYYDSVMCNINEYEDTPEQAFWKCIHKDYFNRGFFYSPSLYIKPPNFKYLDYQ